MIKARHSAFYQTPLEYLLHEMGVDRLVLSGQVTEQCVLYSALDAYVRQLQGHGRPYAVAHIDAELAKSALQMMERNMRAELVQAGDCNF